MNFSNCLYSNVMRAHSSTSTRIFVEIVKISTHMLFVGRCWFLELELSAGLPTSSDHRVLFTSDCHRLHSRGIDKISSGTTAPSLRRYLDYSRTIWIVPTVFPVLIILYVRFLSTGRQIDWKIPRIRRWTRYIGWNIDIKEIFVLVIKGRRSMYRTRKFELWFGAVSNARA